MDSNWDEMCAALKAVQEPLTGLNSSLEVIKTSITEKNTVLPAMLLPLVRSMDSKIADVQVVMTDIQQRYAEIAADREELLALQSQASDLKISREKAVEEAKITNQILASREYDLDQQQQIELSKLRSIITDRDRMIADANDIFELEIQGKAAEFESEWLSMSENMVRASKNHTDALLEKENVIFGLKRKFSQLLKERDELSAAKQTLVSDKKTSILEYTKINNEMSQQHAIAVHEKQDTIEEQWLKIVEQQKIIELKELAIEVKDNNILRAGMLEKQHVNVIQSQKDDLESARLENSFNIEILQASRAVADRRKTLLVEQKDDLLTESFTRQRAAILAQEKDVKRRTNLFVRNVQRFRDHNSELLDTITLRDEIIASLEIERETLEADLGSRNTQITQLQQAYRKTTTDLEEKHARDLDDTHNSLHAKFQKCLDDRGAALGLSLKRKIENVKTTQEAKYTLDLEKISQAHQASLTAARQYKTDVDLAAVREEVQVSLQTTFDTKLKDHLREQDQAQELNFRGRLHTALQQQRTKFETELIKEALEKQRTDLESRFEKQLSNKVDQQRADLENAFKTQLKNEVDQQRVDLENAFKTQLKDEVDQQRVDLENAFKKQLRNEVDQQRVRLEERFSDRLKNELDRQQKTLNARFNIDVSQDLQPPSIQPAKKDSSADIALLQAQITSLESSQRKNATEIARLRQQSAPPRDTPDGEDVRHSDVQQFPLPVIEEAISQRNHPQMITADHTREELELEPEPTGENTSAETDPTVMSTGDARSAVESLSSKTTARPLPGTKHASKRPLEDSEVTETSEQTSRRTKRSRTSNKPTSQTMQAGRRNSGGSDPTKAQRLASDLWSMFVLDGVSAEESEALVNVIAQRLFSSGARTMEDAIEKIDRYTTGRFDAEPPSPRPCFIGSLTGKKRGEGGDAMTNENCPHCQDHEDLVCCHATYLPGVAEGFAARVEGKISSKEARKWLGDAQPRTIHQDGKDVRWILHLRKSA